MRTRSIVAVSPGIVALIFLLVFTGVSIAEDEPEVDNSKTTQKLKSLQRKTGPKPVATIYEFHSSVPEIQAKGATDMFTTALIKSGAFAVAERQRISEGVIREKQLNAAGQSTGTVASSRLAGANYIFEGTISEASSGESQSEGGLSVGGMEVGGSSAKDSIGMDVRVINAESGLVVDAVNVRKKIEASGASLSGLGRLAQSIANLQGKSIPLNPDVSAKSSRKESVDKALRSCIEAAVYELVKRFGEE